MSVSEEGSTCALKSSFQHNDLPSRLISGFVNSKVSCFMIFYAEINTIDEFFGHFVSPNFMFLEFEELDNIMLTFS